MTGLCRAGQLLMVGFAPEEMEEVRSLASQGRLGGVILFERNARTSLEVARLTSQLIAVQAPVPPLVVAVDQEQGRVCRIREGVTLFPGPSELGLLRRPATTARVARWVALELSCLGINLNLAPVADLPETTPWPPVLEGRAFGQEPFQVASQVAAWVRGSQGAGVASCVKHFPGHGSVKGDTHRELPEDVSAEEKILGHHLVPFKAALEAGVCCVMISHVVYPALDPNGPASLSPRLVGGLLRGAMGFQGLVLTDDLDMGAVASSLDPVEAVVKAIQAGVDLALVGRNLRSGWSITHLVEELERAALGRHISAERLEESMQRLLAFKTRWASASLPPRPGNSSRGARRLARRLLREVSLWRAS
jgi:beta-N-acetylhexosaminidase